MGHGPAHYRAREDQASIPRLVLILPWNLKSEIVAQLRYIGSWDGKFVIPIPAVEIIDPKPAARDPAFSGLETRSSVS